MKDNLKVLIYNSIAFVLILFMLGVIGKAAYIMTADRDYWLQVKAKYKSSEKPIEPERGSILSADGQFMSSSLPKYRIYMDYVVNEKNDKRRAKLQQRRDSVFLSKVDSLAEGLASILPWDKARFRKQLMEGMKAKSRHWSLYYGRISHDQYKHVQRLPFIREGRNFSGFHEEKFTQRARPFGSLAERTIGDMYAGKNVAKNGLELYFDKYLRGQEGVKYREKVFNRYVDVVVKPQTDGYDVNTTLSVDMQDICEAALNEQLTALGSDWGVCILMEVATGDVKAIVNLSRNSAGRYEEAKNLAVSNLLEPGSVFKPVSFLVAMNDGKIAMTDQVNTGHGIRQMHGRNMKDHNWHRGGYGTLAVPDIIGQSSNIGVSVLIDKAYSSDPGRFVDGVLATGIGDDLHIPIPGYAVPKIRRPNKDKSNWSNTALPWMSIGYETQIPPISVLAFYNGIANGGKMMRPRFVKSITARGETVEDFPPIVQRERMASAEAVKNIQECLLNVTTVGVGKKIKSRYFSIAGKTGTAQVWTKQGRSSRYLISFVGYFPYENPKYSMIVCMQKPAPASGGAHCGPVFVKIAEGVMARNLAPGELPARDSIRPATPFVANGDMAAARRVLNATGQSVHTADVLPAEAYAWGEAEVGAESVSITSRTPRKGIMPSVEGMGLRDALYLLESMGVKVKAEGSGIVTRQSKPAGAALQKGEVIHIQLSRREHTATKPAEEKKQEAAPDSTTHNATE